MCSQFWTQDKLKISIILIGISLIAWVVVFYILTASNIFGMDTSGNMTMGIFPLQLILFLGLWLTMMVAMMLPTTLPMIKTYATLSEQRNVNDHLFAPTWIFLLGYLVVWTIFGILAYSFNLLLSVLIMNIPVLQSHITLLIAMILVVAGAYQLTPLKYVCLSHCRTPLGFILHHWRKGRVGAFRMGIDHGVYCVGCCWALMLVLVAVGMMNLVLMALLALFIFTEKVQKSGLLVGKIVGIGMIVAGLIILIQPIF